MDENNYNTRLDKKAVLILILYIWIAGITIALNKDDIKESYKIFAEKIIVPNIIQGYNTMISLSNLNKSNQSQLKETDDLNQTR